MSTSILVVDDDIDTADLLCEGLRRRGHEARAANSGAAALEDLRTKPADLVITDVQMDGMRGTELVAKLRAEHPEILPIVLTGAGSLDVAVEAIRAGAYDYLTKPVALDALAIAVERGLHHLLLRRELARLRIESSKASDVTTLLPGTSPAIRATAEMIARVASSDATILITGESGTGKELVARALHSQSSRRDQPFVAINCAAMPAPLLESELFGHVRGAFTDAKGSRQGLFVQAGGGTILLDEIGEMPLEMQVKLLRVLQERRVRPVGGDTEVPIAARVITATNRNLEVEVEERRFREDLYYRINVVPIVVPPLRARDGDVLFLAHYFLAKLAKRTGKQLTGISEPAARRLLAYDWPGNVRELENCMERAVALSRFNELTIDDLPPKLLATQEQFVVEGSPSEMITIDEMERRYVRKVLAAVKGNKTHAARILAIDRRSLYRRLEEKSSTEPEPEPEPTAG